MPLTDLAIRRAKPTNKAYRLFDGGGLYIEIPVTGIDILPLLKRGDSYRVQILRSGSPRRVPAADRHCGSLHRLTGHVLPLGNALYSHFILCAIHPRPKERGFSHNLRINTAFKAKKNCFP